MTVETHLFAALAPLVGDRVYPDIAEEGSALPRIVYQQVGGVRPLFQEGTLPDRENCRMQIVVWAERRLDATALGKQIEEALIAAPGLQVEPLGGRVSRHDEETDLRGSQQDFSIWLARQG